MRLHTKTCSLFGLERGNLQTVSRETSKEARGICFGFLIWIGMI
jgi:hypothetical protein